ncbi:YcaO-like family protein [Paenibacillus sp. FSL H7-0350]|uniref:YcaO-like family protein n=1 Tax=Paenibacillus sp. FSL H7-0350 TaxID=2975345 RepID=UPI00315888D5
MIFESRIGIKFGFGSKLFTNFPVYITSSVIGNFIDDDGYIGPVGSGAVSNNKNESVLKAFSESVERRSLLFGAKHNGSNLSYTFDLINKTEGRVQSLYTSYRETSPFVDTTGTAVHTNSMVAVYNAFVELLEKNAIFLFWYGNMGFVLNEEHSSLYYKKQIKEGVKVTFFLQDFFAPLKIVICMFEDKNSPVHYKFGVGSGLCVEKAKSKAISEAFFLGHYHDIKYFNENDSLNKVKNNCDGNLLFAQKNIEKLKRLPEYKKSEEFIDLDVYSNMSEILKKIPPWVENLHVCILKQKLYSNLIAVKVTSPDLITHIPLKEYIDVNVGINRNTISLSADMLSDFPNCPIV